MKPSPLFKFLRQFFMTLLIILLQLVVTFWKAVDVSPLSGTVWEAELG